MSVKKDPSGRRSVQVEVEVPGTPEQVWDAIATGPGISSWFVPCQVELGKDGKPTKMVLNFGPGMDCPATFTAWEPPHHFSAEAEMAGPGTPTMATEWIVEARSGGKCMVRVVHSLFASTDDWDNQLEGTESGWPSFFRVLALYLQHFRGEPSATMQVMVPASGSVGDAWSAFSRALGVSSVKPGQKCGGANGVPLLRGTVEHIIDSATHPTVVVRLDEPAAGIATLGAFSCGGPAAMVLVGFYLYGNEAKAVAEREEPAWRSWLGEKFASESA